LKDPHDEDPDVRGASGTISLFLSSPPGFPVPDSVEDPFLRRSARRICQDTSGVFIDPLNFNQASGPISRFDFGRRPFFFRVG